MIEFIGGPLDGQRQEDREVTGALIVLNVQLPRCQTYRRLAEARYEYEHVWESSPGIWSGRARFVGFLTFYPHHRLRKDGSRMPAKKRKRRR